MADSSAIQNAAEPAAALHRPLEGIRVLDLTVALAGPYGTLLLGGLGAEVIKIEAPSGGDIARLNPPFYGPEGFHFGAMGDGDVSVSLMARARNKKAVTLDLKSERGRDLFMRLVEQADVIVENLSEGTAERLGVGYEAVSKVNPRIVYSSIQGLGDDHPYPGLKAMDIIVQALSGVMDVTGFADGPPVRFGLPIADLVAPLFACNGILSAIIQRGRTGRGQHVKVSMLDCMASLASIEHFDMFRHHGFPARTGNHQNRLAPFGLFRTSDGHVAIAAAADRWVFAIFEAMGRPELSRDPLFVGRGPRSVNAETLNALIEGWTSRLKTSEVIDALLTKRGVPCAPQRRIEEVMADERLRRRGAIEVLSHPELGPTEAVGPGVPIWFSDAKVGLDKPASELGMDNHEIYAGLLQLDDDELGELRAAGII